MGITFEVMISFCAAFLIVVGCLFLVFRPSTPRREWSLVAALLITGLIELFDLFILYNPEQLLPIKSTVFIFEALLPVSWAFYAVNLHHRTPQRRIVETSLFLLFALILLALSLSSNPNVMIFSPDFGTEFLLFLGPVGFYFYLVLSLYLIIDLVMLERTFSALSRQDRWYLKFEALGIGAIITVQLIYYSQGLLFRTLDMSLVTVRSIVIVLGLLMFLYARLGRGRPERLTLSHTAAFRSVVLLAVSSYLIFVGLAGEGLRYFDPSTNRVFIIGLSLVGGVVLCSLLLSESLRRKTKVFLHKHFYQQKYDYRVLWMEVSERLAYAKDVESRYEAIIEMYCQTFAIQGGALYLNRGGRDGLPAVAIHGGVSVPEELDPEGSLSLFLKKTQWVFNLSENADEISTEDSELLTRHDIQFVVPIFFGKELGGVVVLCRQINANEPVIYEDYDLMKIYGRQVAAVLINDRLSRQLADQREMVAVGKVSSFVMHDLKNLVSILSLVTENAQELIQDRRFQEDMLVTLSNTVRQMNSLIGRLKYVGESNQLTYGLYDLKKLVIETISDLGIDGIMVSGENVEVEIDRNEISKVITNLVLNGIEASNGETSVQIEIGNKNEPFLICRDDGRGMSDEFMSSNLFRLFETTKENGLGIGLYHCRQIVEAHGGRIEVVSHVGKGSEFRVYLPPTLNTEVLSDG